MSFQIDTPEATAAAERQMQALLSRSATDWDFRQKLVSDPRRAMAEYAGREVPGSENFRFIENEADVTIVLPDPAMADGELAEAELEAVAGGVLLEIALAGVLIGMALHALDCENH
jgi:hypothetical protein